MTSKARVKGFGYERELVKFFEKNDHRAIRAWGSNGVTLGEDEDTDLVINLKKTDGCVRVMKAQCKRRKSIPKWIGLVDSVDASIFREDRGKSYIVMELDTFIKYI
jgi:hypothetical protein